MFQLIPARHVRRRRQLPRGRRDYSPGGRPEMRADVLTFGPADGKVTVPRSRRGHEAAPEPKAHFNYVPAFLQVPAQSRP